MTRQSAFQTSMTRDPSRIFYPVRGRIDAVLHKDSPANKTGQTLVTVFLFDEWPTIHRVPVAHRKINAANGEDWSPEKGDLVLVQFIGGDWHDPIVTDWLAPPKNTMEAVASEHPRVHRKHGDTYETWDKDGNRVLHVGSDDTVTIEGEGAVTVNGGNLTVNVTAGNVAVTVSGNLSAQVGGDATVDVDGQTTVTCPTVTVEATTKVTLDTPLVDVTGNIAAVGSVVTTGLIYSNTSIGDPAGTMDEMRTIYNSHTHPENGDGGGTTSAPNEPMT